MDWEFDDYDGYLGAEDRMPNTFTQVVKVAIATIGMSIWIGLILLINWMING